LSKCKGANYCSVKSSEDFEKRLTEEFDYFVNPLVFDLSVKLSNDKAIESTQKDKNEKSRSRKREHCYFELETVYGSPEANKATGELLQVSTLFPSPKKNDQTKVSLLD